MFYYIYHVTYQLRFSSMTFWREKKYRQNAPCRRWGAISIHYCTWRYWACLGGFRWWHGQRGSQVVLAPRPHWNHYKSRVINWVSSAVAWELILSSSDESEPSWLKPELELKDFQLSSWPFPLQLEIENQPKTSWNFDFDFFSFI